MIRTNIILFLLAVFTLAAFAQESRDDLFRRLDTSKGFRKGNVYVRIAKTYIPSEPKNIIKYAGEALKTYREAGIMKNAAYAYRCMGIGYGIQNENKVAMCYFDSCTALAIKEKDSTELASCYENMGKVYQAMSDFTRAAEMMLKGLRIKEAKQANPGSLYNGYLNLAILYSTIGYRDLAIKNFELARTYAVKMNDPNMIALADLNIGTAYVSSKKYKEAEPYLNRAAKQFMITGDSAYLMTIYNSQGVLYMNTGRLEKSEEVFILGYELSKRSPVKEDLVTSMMNVANIANRRNKYKEAVKILLEASAIAKQFDLKTRLVEIYEALYEINVNDKNFSEGLWYYKLMDETEDSILNRETLRNMNELETKYQSDKKDHEIALLSKDKALQEQENARQRAVRNGFVAGFVLICGIAFLALRGYRNKRKANGIILKQKEEVERHRDLIEEKQKEILDSIHYAKRIQRSLISSEKYVDNNLKRLMKK